MIDTFLEYFSEDNFSYSAAYAIEIMGKYATKEVVNLTISKLLSDANSDVRGAAAVAIGTMGEKAASDEVISTCSNLYQIPMSRCDSMRPGQ